jgi:hypothetical protein
MRFRSWLNQRLSPFIHQRPVNSKYMDERKFKYFCLFNFSGSERCVFGYQVALVFFVFVFTREFEYFCFPFLSFGKRVTRVAAVRHRVDLLLLKSSAHVQGRCLTHRRRIFQLTK